MTTLARQLTRLTTEKAITPADLEAARLFLLDAAANMIAGQNSVAGQKILSWARNVAPGGDLSKMDPGRKAFVLGSLCHILEVDDLHRASVVHPGCVVAPVIFALGTSKDGKTGLTGFLKGVEATTRVGMAVGPEHYQIWHNTATCGPFGSAVAAAHLLDLDENQCVYALGNAGSQSAGFWQFLDSGAETKHLHAGRGAEAGVVAAQLAAQGFTGASDILEGSRGFFQATCTNPPVENLLDEPGGPWQIHQNSIKPWPSCRHTHPAIEAGLELYKQVGDRHAGIKEIAVSTYQSAINLCDRPKPQSEYAAKFSLQHCLATSLKEGAVDLSSFDDQARSRSAELTDKVSIRLDKTYESAYPTSWGSAVVLHFDDGSTLKYQTSNAKGDPGAPLSTPELIKKSKGLLAFAKFENPQVLLKQFEALGDDGPVPDIFSLLG